MIRDPQQIERTSFDIIARELDVAVPEEHAPTIVRIIHTTADFEYARITDIHRDAVRAGIEAIGRGCAIYADTAMICAGVNGRALAGHGSRIYTLVAADDVSREASARGVTRSIVGMERACADPAVRIFAVGNAPTALDALRRAIARGAVRPDLVIGVPVGFVGAAESKEEIKTAGVPYIVTDGRKGGSTVAVAIINSLLYQA